MFLIAIEPKELLRVRDEKVDFIDIRYSDSLTQQIFTNFSAVWGKVGWDRANRELAKGNAVGLNTGFDVAFGASAKSLRHQTKIYWFREFHNRNSLGEIISHGMRVFFIPDADKKYPRWEDKSRRWGSGYDCC